MLGSVPWEHELHAAFNAGFIIFKLVKQLISCQKGNGLCGVAECRFGDDLESIKDDSIEDIEAVIAFVPNLGKGRLANYHHVLHILIVEAGYCFLPAHLLPVAAVLALPLLALLVDLVDAEAVVQHEERSPPSHEERMVLLEVGVIRAEALPHLPAEQREGDDLVVD